MTSWAEHGPDAAQLVTESHEGCNDVLWVPSIAALPSLCRPASDNLRQPSRTAALALLQPWQPEHLPTALIPPLWPQACSSVLHSSHSYQLPAECLAHLIQLVFGARHQVQRGALSCEGLCDRLQAQLLSPRGVTMTLMMPDDSASRQLPHAVQAPLRRPESHFG